MKSRGVNGQGSSGWIRCTCIPSCWWCEREWQADRSSSELNKVFSMPRHDGFAMMLGYGLTLLGGLYGHALQKVVLGGAGCPWVGLVWRCSASKRRRAANFTPVARPLRSAYGELHRTHRAGLGQGSMDMTVCANLILLAIPSDHRRGSGLRRQSGRFLADHARLFTLSRLVGQPTGTRANRTTWFRLFWFGPRHVTPPFTGPKTGTAQIQL